MQAALAEDRSVLVSFFRFFIRTEKRLYTVFLSSLIDRAGSSWIPRKYANPTGSICKVRAGGKKIHRTTLMREKWVFGSIYERPGLYEDNGGLWHPPASLVPLGMTFS